MSFLSRKQISEYVERTDGPRLFTENFDPNNLQQCSYDLALGEEVYVVGDKAPRRLSRRDPFLRLSPGQFAILTCHEMLDIPENLVAFITLRNRYKMEGLLNISGFHVDPTFKGRLLFAVHNIGPTDVRLKFGEPTFTIFFALVGEGVGEPRKNPPLKGISLSDVQQLGGATVTLAKLKKEVDQVRFMLLVYAPFAIAALLALLISLIRAFH